MRCTDKVLVTGSGWIELSKCLVSFNVKDEYTSDTVPTVSKSLSEQCITYICKNSQPGGYMEKKGNEWLV